MRDGDRILIKNENQIGGIEVLSQTSRPEEIEYRYWFSDDLNATYTDVKAENKGIAKGGEIAFGVFKLDWSISKKGIGYLSFDEADTTLRFATCPTSFEEADFNGDDIHYVSKSIYFEGQED